jgi:serine/threonine-protein kinase ATR
MTDGNHQPPPSTIAAQIVHNRANVARQEPENKALFGKLLHEYLRDPIAEDSSVETNAQLIQVVAEAGLDVMLSDDPFAPSNLLEQAKESLLVMRLTVVRRPEVLQYSPEDDDAQPPLLLWILAKILRLLGRKSLRAMQDDLCTLLSTMLGVLLGKNRSLHQAKAFEDMLCQLVEGLLCALKNRFMAD